MYSGPLGQGSKAGTILGLSLLAQVGTSTSSSSDSCCITRSVTGSAICCCSAVSVGCAGAAGLGSMAASFVTWSPTLTTLSAQSNGAGSWTEDAVVPACAVAESSFLFVVSAERQAGGAGHGGPERQLESCGGPAGRPAMRANCAHRHGTYDLLDFRPHMGGDPLVTRVVSEGCFSSTCTLAAIQLQTHRSRLPRHYARTPPFIIMSSFAVIISILLFRP